MMDAVVRLTDPKTLRAYAHPLRLALIGLLRREGPLTATKAAARLGESVPSCSFHLRQLAKYGLVEQAGGGHGREKPWRATALATAWDSTAEDPAARAAAAHLDAVVFEQFAHRVRAWLGRRGDDPPAWQAVSGLGDALVFVTPDELRQLSTDVDALLQRYRHRAADPAQRPTEARPVTIIQVVFPAEP
jgi:DNA-binding transcriptional ArsR family regulator